MTTASEVIKPPRTSVGLVGWLKKNLFSTWYNALLTLLSLWLIYAALGGLLKWAFTEATWGVVTSNLRLFMVGTYPPDQVWRVGLCVFMVSVLSGLSWGIWGGVVRSFAVALAAGFGALAILPFGLETRGWLAGNLVLILVGYFVGRRLPGAGRWVLIGWLLSFVLTILLLGGFKASSVLPPVSTNQWGGLLLTFLLSIVGIVASFPLGVLLALGRRSTLPVVRIFSILFIELVRGVPLVTVLFMSNVMLPLFLPKGMTPDSVLRAMVAVTLFSAAYMAENVRGGLQAIPVGQYEAAKAIGLNAPLTMLLIVLPQALRLVIPAVVGLFIALFKDTTLVAIVNLLEILRIGQFVVAQPEWLGRYKEVYAFIFVVFFVFSYAMSYASYKLEAALGLGKR
jgi:general L-amino acid transport system permease protein